MSFIFLLRNLVEFSIICREEGKRYRLVFRGLTGYGSIEAAVFCEYGLNLPFYVKTSILPQKRNKIKKMI